jgi:hypothetical protein
MATIEHERQKLVDIFYEWAEERSSSHYNIVPNLSNLLMFLDYNRLINKRKVKKYINKAKGKVE